MRYYWPGKCIFPFPLSVSVPDFVFLEFQLPQISFRDELGTPKDHKVKFYLEEQAQPQFLKARPLLLTLGDKVAEELDRLQAKGIIVRTKFLKWATPIIPELSRVMDQ